MESIHKQMNGMTHYIVVIYPRIQEIWSFKKKKNSAYGFLAELREQVSILFFSY